MIKQGDVASGDCSPIQQKIGRGLGWEGLDEAEKGGWLRSVKSTCQSERKWLGQLKKKMFLKIPRP